MAEEDKKLTEPQRHTFVTVAKCVECHARIINIEAIPLAVVPSEERDRSINDFRRATAGLAGDLPCEECQDDLTWQSYLTMFLHEKRGE